MPSAVRKESFGSVTVFWLQTVELIRCLRRSAEHLVRERPDVRAVHLFGSLADGTAVPGSDADLLVVLGHSESRWLDRPLEFQPFFEECGIPVELFCYTTGEVVDHPLARRARDHGMLLARS